MNPDLESYFAAIHARRGTAQSFSYRAVSMPNWKPRQSRCHEDIDYWVSLNPHLKPVRGWMITGHGSGESVHYTAHSLFDEDGELYDISLGGDHYQFIRHVGTPEEFSAVRKACSSLFYPCK